MGKTAVFFIITLLFFAGCTTIPATPTPVVPLAQATLVVERPSATPLPAPTLTAAATETAVSTPIPPSATPTQTPTAALPPFTETPAAAATPNPNATPRPGFSPPILSSQGQLAFVQDEVLYVETAVGSGTFLEVDHYVTIDPVWSPDGEKLLYISTEFPSAAYDFILHQDDLRLWSINTQTNISLFQIANDLPSLEFSRHFTWSPDSTKLLFSTFIDPPQVVEGFGEINDVFLVVDLLQNNSSVLTGKWNVGDDISLVTDEFIVINRHLAGPLAELEGFTYQGETLWKWNIYDFLFAYAPNKEFFITKAGLSSESDFNTIAVEKVELETGMSANVWQGTLKSQDFPCIQPEISPDNLFVAFYTPPESEWIGSCPLGTLHLIDLNGRIYHQCEACLVLDWQPGGGPVAVQTLPSGENQLVYLPLDGSLPRIFVTPKTFSFGSGEWSKNGRYFVYSTFDEASSAAYLYLWQPNSGEPTLIHAAASDDPFSQFAWMPDSSGFYFNAQGVYTELWGYGAETAEIQQITGTNH